MQAESSGSLRQVRPHIQVGLTLASKSDLIGIVLSSVPTKDVHGTWDSASFLHVEVDEGIRHPVILTKT
jgi:hypothetical protein